MTRPLPTPPHPDQARWARQTDRRRREDRIFIWAIGGFVVCAFAVGFAATAAAVLHPSPAIREIAIMPEGCRVYELDRSYRPVIVCPAGWVAR